jgi:hypothetical protein
MDSVMERAAVKQAASRRRLTRRSAACSDRGPWPPQAEGENHFPDDIGLGYDGVDLFGDRDRTVVTQERKFAVKEFPFFNGQFARFNAVALDILNAVDPERPTLDRDFLAGQPYHPLDDEIVSVARHNNISSLRIDCTIGKLGYQEQITRSQGGPHACPLHDDELEITPQNQEQQKE